MGIQTGGSGFVDAPGRAAAPPWSMPPQATAVGDWHHLSVMVRDICESAGVEAALDVLADLARARPRNGNLLAAQGQLFAASGRPQAAVAALMTAAECGAELEVLPMLATLAFPGPRYHEYLRLLHDVLRPATYLEIGVFDGDALALARPGTRAIGVDPAPRAASRRAYAAATEIRVATSDAFFAALPADGPGAIGLDLAFIDGLHVFEQVLRDFINVERRCHSGSVVVLHDTLPVAAAAASRERHTSYWCGDVWKMLPCLRQYRPDLRLLTIPTHPSGLTLITGLDSGSRVLQTQFERAVADHIDATLPEALLPPAVLGDVANEPHRVRSWLQPH